MADKTNLIFWLILWVIVTAFVIRNQWSKKLPSVGLPTAYLFSLSLIHWFGGLIYTFPWYSPQSAYLIQAGSSISNVTEGFIQSTYGVIGFGIGSTFLARWFLKTFKPFWLNKSNYQSILIPPFHYVILGLFFYFILLPVLGGIPSITSVVSSGLSLANVGLCLGCWIAISRGDRRKLLKWIVLTITLPTLTVLMQGFLGYGTSATIIVFVFVFNFYRPRWHAIVVTLITIVLGLSVFVNYMQARTELRATVWGNQGIEARIEEVSELFYSFEIIDPFKQQHLEAIDERLNQNILVGKAVNYLSNGYVSYGKGETLRNAVVAVIPRILWPNKPVYAGSPGLVSKYTGMEFAAGTSVGVGQVLEFYINFGTLGVIFGFMVFGTILRIVDISAAQNLFGSNWSGFTGWFLVGIGMINPGGSLVEVVSTIAGSIVLAVILHEYAKKRAKDRYIQKRKRSTIL